MKCSLVICVVLAVILQVRAANILGFFATPSRQQWNVHETLMRGLAESGHQVQVVSPYSPDGRAFPASNYHHIQVNLKDIADHDLELLHRNFTHVTLDNSTLTNWATKRVPKLLEILLNVTVDVLQSPEVEQLKSTQHFDLIVYSWFFNDFALGLSGHFGCPSVLLSPSVPAIQMLRDYVGNPQGAAYTPAMFSPYTTNMTFAERAINLGLAGVERLATYAYQSLVMDSYYQRLFAASNQPSYRAVRQNVSLVLVNQHFSEGYPMASMPGMVEVGGLTLNFTKEPLPTDIRQFLDSATDGAVLLNFDESLTMSTQFDSKKITAIMRVFQRLPLKLVIRWESDRPIAHKPANVLALKQLPQNAILSHRNIRLFISSCDRRSINEARYNGVPVLGVPLHQDDHQLLRPAMEEGWAMPMSFHYLDERSLHFFLDHMLNNTRYADNVRDADLFRDRPQAPLDVAIWWVEYVLRHGGAKHMQSPAVALNWFQLNSLDVIGALALLAIVVCSIPKGLLVLFRRIKKLCNSKPRSVMTAIDKKNK